MLKRIIGFYLFIAIVFVFNSCRESKLASSYAVRNKLVERKPGDVDTVTVQTKYWTYDKKNRSYFEMARFAYENQKGIIFTSDIFRNSARLGMYDKYEKVKFFTLNQDQGKKLYEFFGMLKYSAGDIKGIQRIDYTLDKDVFVSCLVENKMSPDGRVIPGIRGITLWMYDRKHEFNHRKFLKQLDNIINKY